MSNTINNGIPFVPENTIDPAAGLNLSLNVVDALLQVLVVSIGLNTPPGSPANGARYIVGTAPTGAWAGQSNKLARFLDGAWQFFDARYALNAADGLWYVRSASSWATLAGGGATLPVVQALSSTRNLALADINTFNVNSTTNNYTATIPPQSSVTWTADAEIHFLPTSSGNIVITAGAGVSLNGVVAGSVTLSTAFGAASMKRIAVDSWWLGGVIGTLADYTNLTLLAPYTWDAAGDAADYHQPSYTKVDNVVRLRGKVTLSGTHADPSTVNNTTISTLPVGFRPAKRKAFQVFWDTNSPLHFAYCLVFVNPDGTIVLLTPSPTQPYPFTEGHFPLDQIWFDLAP